MSYPETLSLDQATEEIFSECDFLPSPAEVIASRIGWLVQEHTAEKIVLSPATEFFVFKEGSPSRVTIFSDCLETCWSQKSVISSLPPSDLMEHLSAWVANYQAADKVQAAERNLEACQKLAQVDCLRETNISN